MKNSEQPIAPITLRHIGVNDFRIATEKDIRDGQFLTSFGGLTKREYFAGLAMQGYAASEIEFDDVSAMAKSAILFADTLLAELEKQEG